MVRFNILEKVSWHVVVLIAKPALLALGVAILDVGLLDGAILQAVEEFLRDVREAAAHR